MNILLLAAVAALPAAAQVVVPAPPPGAPGKAMAAVSAYQETAARRQTADKLKRVCDAKGFEAVTERARVACAYARAHADAEMANFLAFQWDMNRRRDQAYSPGLRNPHADRAAEYERYAAEMRRNATAIGAVRSDGGLDSVGLEAGKDYAPGR